MRGVEIVRNLKDAIEQETVSKPVQEIIKRTVLNLRTDLLDHARSKCEVKLKEKYVHLEIYSFFDKSIPIEITFSEMIDFYSEEASIFEMQEVEDNIEEICSVINMWLASDIEKIQYKRGDYIGRTDYFGINKNMSSRRLFTRTTLFGRIGKKVVKSYQPWIKI